MRGRTDGSSQLHYESLRCGYIIARGRVQYWRHQRADALTVTPNYTMKASVVSLSSFSGR